MRSARWFRLSIGLLFVVVPLWVLFTRLDAIWNGHPAYPTTLLVTVGVGLCLIAFALWPWRPDPEPAGPPWEQHDGAGEKAGDPTLSPGAKAARGSTGWRIAGRIVVAILAVLFVGVLAWLRPFTAGADALAALHSDAVVTVVDNPTTIEMSPAASATPSVGLVFSPGARVDARAYAALLRPSAEAGYLVVILKEPFGLALTQAGQSAGPITDHPDVSRWAVGGHSLGGVSAASFAGDHLDTVDGLLLWASYPNQDMSADVSLQVESIYGSNDLLATPEDIDLSRSLLPPNATFTEIEGGVHAFFADYGQQPGDGEPAVSRESASAQIASTTAAFLGRVAVPVPTS